MSIFYLIPPRPFLGDRFAAFLQTYFPGLDWDSAERTMLADVLADAAASSHSGVYVVCRDDLPRDESPAQALVNGFGAEAGDEIIEIRPGGRADEMITRRWRVNAAD